MANESGGMYGSGYGKRRLWQWVLLYVVVGGLVYYGIYAAFFRNKPGLYGNNPPTNTSSSTAANSTNASAVVRTKTSSDGQAYLADSSGRPLYTYGGDTAGVSNCSGSCVASWPVYTATVTVSLPANVSVIARSDGTKQYAYKALPLYRFSGDTASSQPTGDGLSNFHLARP